MIIPLAVPPRTLVRRVTVKVLGRGGKQDIILAQMNFATPLLTHANDVTVCEIEGDTMLVSDYDAIFKR